VINDVYHYVLLDGIWGMRNLDDTYSIVVNLICLVRVGARAQADTRTPARQVCLPLHRTGPCVRLICGNDAQVASEKQMRDCDGVHHDRFRHEGILTGFLHVLASMSYDLSTRARGA
jgi:hypothetical protein